MVKNYIMQWSIYWKLERLSRNPEIFNFKDMRENDRIFLAVRMQN